MTNFFSLKQRVFLILAAVVFVTPNFSFAAPQDQKVVRINPESLRTMFLKRNMEVLISMNQVQQAKEQVNIARGNLLPSINLGGALTSGSNFVLSTVSVLLPFLMPSKWLDLKENTYLLQAQGTAHYLAQLNGYASAYALYMTIAGDISMREQIYAQYQTLQAIADQMKIPADMGIIRKEEYLQALSQAQLARTQVSQLDELIRREKAAIRHMLALDLNKEIEFDLIKLPSITYESSTPEHILNLIHKTSPESAQLDQMITAAKAAKWSKGFSFLTGASLGRQRVDGSFGDISRTGSVGLGFGYFPHLSLSSLQIKQIEMRKENLRLEQAELIESTLASLQEAQIQFDLASQAEANLQQVYQSELLRYKMGITDILHVLSAANGVTTAVINKVQAETNLNVQRVNFYRLLLKDQFAVIQRCNIKRNISKKEQVSLDQACGYGR